MEFIPGTFLFFVHRQKANLDILCKVQLAFDAVQVLLLFYVLLERGTHMRKGARKQSDFVTTGKMRNVGIEVPVPKLVRRNRKFVERTRDPRRNHENQAQHNNITDKAHPSKHLFHRTLAFQVLLGGPYNHERPAVRFHRAKVNSRFPAITRKPHEESLFHASHRFFKIGRRFVIVIPGEIGQSLLKNDIVLRMRNHGTISGQYNDVTGIRYRNRSDRFLEERNGHIKAQDTCKYFVP